MQVKGKQKPNCPQCGQKDESKFRKFTYKKVSGEVVYYWQSWCAIDFHHRNPKEKKFNIGSMYKLKPTKARLAEVFAEIQKCDIVCAICHRLVHHELNRLSF